MKLKVVLVLMEQIKKWFKDVELKIIHFNEIESGFSINGKKSKINI